jgi:hypothetical protein
LALAADAPGSLADLVASTPNSEGVFATSPKTPVILHIQSGLICQGFYFSIKLVGLSVDDIPPKGESASCRFKSTDRDHGGVELRGDIVLSAERVTEKNARDPRGDAIAAFLRDYRGSHTERSYVEFDTKIVADGRTYKADTARFTLKDDAGTKMNGLIWVGIVQDWIIGIKLVEPDGETRPDEPLLALLWSSQAAKVLAAYKLRHGQAH